MSVSEKGGEPDDWIVSVANQTQNCEREGNPDQSVEIGKQECGQDKNGENDRDELRSERAVSTMADRPTRDLVGSKAQA